MPMSSLKITKGEKKIRIENGPFTYHKISGVGVPSAWQLSIIESPEKRSHGKRQIFLNGFLEYVNKI